LLAVLPAGDQFEARRDARFRAEAEAGSRNPMEWILILALVVVAVALLASIRRRRFFNRGRGTISGRWNRRI
jgi:MYXO-CTERM domain-containing protein